MSEVQLLEHMLANARKGLPVGYGILDRYGNPIRDVGLAVIDLRGWRELTIKAQPELGESKKYNYAKIEEVKNAVIKNVKTSVINELSEPKKELTKDAEVCDECDSRMDMWQTQYLNDGYDYIQWICQNDKCEAREDRHLCHDDKDVQSQLL